VGQYGNARRNSIIGPGSKVFDMAFTKIVPLKESARARVSRAGHQHFQHTELLFD